MRCASWSLHSLRPVPRSAGQAGGRAFLSLLGGVVGALAVGAGCGAAAPADPAAWVNLDAAAVSAAQHTAWTGLGESAFDSDGLGAAVDLGRGATAGPAVFRVYHPSGKAGCTQLDSVVDPAAGAWVTPPTTRADYGSYCQSCPQRVAVAVGGGLFVLPSSEPLPPAAAHLQLRPAVRECATLLAPLPGAGAAEPLRIEALPESAVDDRREGVVLLEVAITTGSSLHDSRDSWPALLDAALTQVNALLGPGHLSVRPVRVRRIAGEDPLTVEPGEHAALDRREPELHHDDPDGRAPDDTWVPLVLAGCLQVRDPVLAQTTEVEGLVPHIPDGFPAPGRMHGVFLKGRSCSADSRPTEWEASVLGKLLAHELGHYLGLYHSVEQDGTTDALADTTGEDLMNFRPLAVAAPALTAGQFAVMRRHPAIHWQ